MSGAFGIVNPALAFTAGALTILLPCVFPLVPIVLGSAATAHRRGPIALAAGLILSFTTIGFLVATAGPASGFDGETVRIVGAVAMVLVGLALIIPQTSQFLSRAAGPLVNWANAQQSTLARYGLLGQAGIGVLLGLIWSPCVGPTLGAATVLAARGEHLFDVAVTMAAFGLGIATVMLVLSLAARQALQRWRGKAITAGNTGKRVLGSLLGFVGLLVLTGLDHVIEGAFLAISPAWLVELTSSV
jgi:cytochrome c-type biogenesis protein